MFDQPPCLRIKRRMKNGRNSEIEIRPSLLRWVLIALVVIVLLLRGFDPTEVLRTLLPNNKLQTMPALPTSVRQMGALPDCLVCRAEASPDLWFVRTC